VILLGVKKRKVIFLGLLQNRTIQYQYPIQQQGGTTANITTRFRRNANSLNRYTNDYMDPKSAYPVGYTHPHSWEWAREPGGMAARMFCEGDLNYANLAGGKNAEADLSGIGWISDAAGALIAGMVAALDGLGDIDADIRGRIDAAAALLGAGNLTGALGAIASMVADLTGDGIVDADIYAYGNMSADLTPFTALSPQSLAAAVWNALAADFNAAGTMGQKLNSAASAGDPWVTDLPGPYIGIQAGKIVGDYLDQKISDVPGDVWDEPVASHTAAGTFGLFVKKIKSWVGWLRSLL
jgi:hypothetical protein